MVYTILVASLPRAVTNGLMVAVFLRHEALRYLFFITTVDSIILYVYKGTVQVTLSRDYKEYWIIFILSAVDCLLAIGTMHKLYRRIPIVLDGSRLYFAQVENTVLLRIQQNLTSCRYIFGAGNVALLSNERFGPISDSQADENIDISDCKCRSTHCCIDATRLSSMGDNVVIKSYLYENGCIYYSNNFMAIVQVCEASAIVDIRLYIIGECLFNVLSVN